MKHTCYTLLVLVLISFQMGCKNNNAVPAQATIDEIQLKRGELISCGPADMQFGKIDFATSCGDAVKENFNLGLKLLHSFEYDEAEKVFSRVIDKEPGCAMAYWGVAMANFHALWTPPTEAELKKGAKAIEIAQSLETSSREKSYIQATAVFFNNWQTLDHATRTKKFTEAMGELYAKDPADKEAAIFYALALNASASPSDKTFANQIKAGKILDALYPGEPNHPGIVHYIIHTYDSPEMAEKGLPAARKYAALAPSSAHALHMPSHIFTRLGLWRECIQSNLASVSSAQCYAQSSGLQGHWDEELHGQDYLAYAYLQAGDNNSAKKTLDYIDTLQVVTPQNFKVAYAFAAIPARYVLENKLWKEAASLELRPNFPWAEYPWQESIVHFTRLLGAVHTNQPAVATTALDKLKALEQKLVDLKDAYKANQVAIQVKAGEAWINYLQGNKPKALTLMQEAVVMEDKTSKHPVTPGEVLPAQELLADMLFALNENAKALAMYELNLQKRPNRFNGLYGAALAASRTNDMEKARQYYQKLVAVAPGSTRVEVSEAKEWIAKHGNS